MSFGTQICRPAYWLVFSILKADVSAAIVPSFLHVLRPISTGFVCFDVVIEYAMPQNDRVRSIIPCHTALLLSPDRPAKMSLTLSSE